MGGTLRVGVVGEYVNIDGHYYSTKAGLSHWMSYDTLTRYDDDLKVQPMLAESWEMSSDARELKLNLRKGVTFHNGREFTSDDVLYNLERMRDAKVTAGIQTGFIPPNSGWEAPDKNTVIIKSERPWPAVYDFLEVVSIVDKDTMEGPDGKSKVVGTGPFAFTEWVQGSHMAFTKNKNYWDAGKPYMDGIHISILRDQQSMVSGSKRAPSTWSTTPTLPDYVRLRNDPRFQAVPFPNPPNFHMIQPNSTLQAADRQAGAAGVRVHDRPPAHASTTSCRESARSSRCRGRRARPAYQPEKNQTFAFNLDKAKSLFQEAGVSTPLELEMVFNSQNRRSGRPCRRSGSPTWRRSASR